jgi:aryl-alcohol dehydrogenase-like predicted oxidoreductase
LHDVVKAGKARYIGASSIHVWQFARAFGNVRTTRLDPFRQHAELVNLLYREEEREMLPLCTAAEIGVIPWSPQARGRLTRNLSITGTRSETVESVAGLFVKTADADKKVVDHLAAVATARGVARAQVALA